MRVLILSCRIGGGHDACARAVSDELTARGNECVTRDALRFVLRSLPAIFSRSHIWIYRHTPAVFGKVYRFGETHPAAFRPGTCFRRAFRIGTRRLSAYLKEGGFDTVICTHVFPAMMVSDVVKKNETGEPPVTCFVATDYTGSPGLAESNLDYYFIPDRALEAAFAVGEIDSTRMIASGIPVRRAFYRRTPTFLAKERSGLSGECRHMVMMCGSMGCGPMYGLTLSLASELRENELLTVVCGTNKALYRKLKARVGENPRVRILSFVKDVAGLLDSADLYLTKPGGISVTEAAEKQLPMVLIDSVAGCEDYNLRFFVELGAAKTARTEEETCALSLELLRDDARLRTMTQAYEGRCAEGGARRICEVLEKRHDRMGAT